MAPPPLIAPEELAERLRDAVPPVVVDCRFDLAEPDRGRRLHAEGHIPGAVYAHLDEDLSGPIVKGRTGRHPLPVPERFAETLQDWGVRAGRLVIGYDDSGGTIAARLWWLLRWIGHDEASVLDGGLAAWVRSGCPLSRERAVNARGFVTPRVRAGLTVGAADIAQSSASVLLDARAPERFRGEVEPIDPVAGHIPGARSLPVLSLLDQQGRLRPAEAIRREFELAIGETPPDRVVAYCGSGVTACHLILAAEHAGLGGVRLYPGSWSEWIVDPTRPTEQGDPSTGPS